MTQAAPAAFKIPTTAAQRRCPPCRVAQGRTPGARPRPRERDGRAATRGGGEVIELEYGIAVYPAREDRGRWRAVWHENGQRQQCEDKLAAKLEKVTERLEADGHISGASARQLRALPR